MAPWRGVNLGGWLLLEPGTAATLFKRHKNRTGGFEARPRCEWDLMCLMNERLGKQKAAAEMKKHRDTHTTKKDFERIRELGLNAVRLPIGSWVILGPSEGEPYHGPGLEYIDRAVAWAEECGLEIVLDLHGCPGGESGEAPCGRRQRPDGTWHWKQWRIAECLQALRVLASRYRTRKCVTGIAVCNEPSNEIPIERLCGYYEKAIAVIRKAGMPAAHVSICLPLFQRSESEFMQYWDSRTGGKHGNVTFDVHLYHCFENDFNGKSCAQQLRATQTNASMLRKYPMVVGEWSLALGIATWATCGRTSEDDVYKQFASAQLEAYKKASHGWFFWNWTEADAGEWNFQKALDRGLLSLTDKPRKLPRWVGDVEDPLEEELNPSPPEPRVLYGEGIYLRTWYGRYIDAEAEECLARWHDKGTWQQFTFCPPASSSSKQAAKSQPKRPVRTGDVVRLQTHQGSFLTASKNGVISAPLKEAETASATEFEVELNKGSVLKHRGIIHLKNRLTKMVMDCDDEAEGVFARYPDTGTWQSFAVEKDVPELPAAVASKRAAASASKPEMKQRSQRGTAAKNSPGKVNKAASLKTHRTAAAKKGARLKKVKRLGAKALARPLKRKPAAAPAAKRTRHR